MFLPYTIYAQEFRVTGVVRDTSGISVMYATVVASSLDSVAKYHTLTDSLGGFDLYLPNGEYDFSISMMGYQPHVSKLLIRNKEVDLRDIVLAEQDRYLKEAVVTDSRIRYTSDGYEINLKNNSLLAKKNLPDILNLSPGVTALANSFSVYGKRVVEVYIDHRKIRMSGDQLISYLNSLTGDQVEKIEVIVNAPAKYGMTALGMPVIIVKTIKEEGGNLQFLARVSRNDSKEVYSPLANVSHRRGRLSVYGDISFLNMHSQNQLFNIESFGSGVPLISGIQTTSIHIPYSLNGTAGLSLDLTPKDFVAFEYSGSRIKRVERQMSEDLFSKRESLNTSDNLLVRYDRKINETTSFQLTTDIGRMDKEQTEVVPDHSLIVNERTFLNIEGNFTTSFFPKNDKFTTGFTYSNFSDKTDQGHQTQFDYTEQQSVVFLSYGYVMDKFSLQAGGIGMQNRINSKDFFSFNPTLNLTYYLSKKKGNLMSLQLLRKFTHPRVSMLNPVPVVGNNQFVETGNPLLMPYASNSANYRFTFKRNYSLRISYSYADDIISPFFYQEGNILYRTYTNRLSSREVQGGLYASLMYKQWLMVNASIDGRYEQLVDQERTIKNSTAKYSLFATLNLPKKYTFNIIMFGDIGTRRQINSVSNNPFFATIDMSKLVAKDRLKITFSVSDLTNSNKYRTLTTNIDGVTRTVKYGNSATAFSLSLSTNFKWGSQRARTKKAGSPSDLRGRMAD